MNATITTYSNGTADLNGFNDAVAGLTMTGGNVTTETGTLTLNGNVSATSDDSAVISGNLYITGTRTFNVTHGPVQPDLIVSANIGGPGSIAVTGNGTLLLSGTNTFAGSTSITTATVEVQNGNAVPDTSNVSLSGNSTLQLLNDETIGGLNDGGSANTGTVDLGNHTLTVNGVVPSTFFGLIEGVGGNLVKTGVNSLTLRGANNTYTGNTTVAGGLLTATADGAMGPALAAGIFVLPGGQLRFNSVNYTTAEPLQIAGSGLNGVGALTGINGTFAGNVTLAAAAQLGGRQGGTLTLNGTVNNNNFTLSVGGSTLDFNTVLNGVVSGGGNLVKQGPATLFLNAAETYGGSTSITGGTVQLGEQRDPVHERCHGRPGAALDLHSFNDTIASLGDGTHGGGTVSLGNATLTTGGGNATTTFSGVISGVGGSLVKVGLGNFTLGGSSANTYTGTTTVNEGILLLGKASGQVSVPGNLVIGDGDGADLDIVRLLSDGQIASTASITINSDGELDFNGHNATFGDLVLNGSTIATGTGTLTLTGNVTASSSTPGNAAVPSEISGILDLGNATRTFTVNSGSNSTLDLDISAKIIADAAGVGLIKTGTGKLQFSGNQSNTYTGDTTVSLGNLTLAKSGNATAVAGNLVVGTASGNVAFVNWAASNQLGANTVLETFSNGTANLAGFNDTANGLVMVGGTITTGGGTLTVTGDVQRHFGRFGHHQRQPGAGGDHADVPRDGRAEAARLAHHRQCQRPGPPWP